MRRVAGRDISYKNKLIKITKTLGKMLLNYFKLLLIPFVFGLILIALIVKGIKILIEKATA